MLPRVFLEGKNDLIHAVENIGHARVGVHLAFRCAPDRYNVGHERVCVCVCVCLCALYLMLP
jgi:hypothetical protein